MVKVGVVMVFEMMGYLVDYGVGLMYMWFVCVEFYKLGVEVVVEM